MKKPYLILVFTFFTSLLWAQKYTMTGIVLDSTGKPLEAATVLLLNPTDSSLVSFGRTNDKGTFSLRNVPNNAAHLLKVTFVGYEPYFQDVAKGITDNPHDVGAVRMTPLSMLLNEAVVKGEKDPVKIKGDTTEFNATSFKTQPNATAEDLLKKLPGVEVGRDGSVSAQGEQVAKILVNGKRFFGTDPKVATQNLPAGAIDKVQVYDDKSEQAKFSGVDDGQREKTINFQLKDQYNKGTFGNATAGYGTNDRYDLKGALNKFTKSQQLSFIGMGNNINRQGFSVEDYMSYTGASQRMASGGQVRLEFDGNNSAIPLDFSRATGFTTTWAGGVNYNNIVSTKTEINGSYFYNRSDRTQERNVTRENFLPTGGSFKSYSTALQNVLNDNHRVNFTLEQKLDSLNSLRLTSILSFTENRNLNNSVSETRNVLDSIQNTGDRDNNTVGNGLNAQNNLLFRHRFMKKGRTLSANLNYNYSDNVRDIKTDAVNRFFGTGGSSTARVDTIDQTDSRKNTRDNYGTNISYTEPLGNRMYLEFNYAYQKTDNDAERSVFRIKNGERTFDSLLSNVFRNDFIYNRGGVTYRMNRKEWNFSAGVAYQQSVLRGVNLRSEIERTFKNVLPSARFNYSPAQGQNFVFDYDAEVREPSVDQLQPIRDNTDPLNVSVGNPDLKPEYGHRFRVRYNKFNMASFRSFFGNVNFRYTTDKITNAQIIYPNLSREYKPVNVKDDYQLTGNLSMGLPIQQQKLRFNVNAQGSYNRGINLINAVENVTQRSAIGGGVRFDLRLRDSFEFSLNGRLTYNQTAYSLQKELNQAFFNHDYEASFSWTLPWSLRLSSEFNYTIVTGSDFGNNTAIPIWNAGLSKYLLKNKRGEIKFSVFDLLNRNVGFTRTADVNFIQDERIPSLGRYFMLSFTYAINPLMNGPRGGGPRMMMRFNN